MSWTRTVPAAVPSLRHSSRPDDDVLAEKNSAPFIIAVRLVGAEPVVPVKMSRTTAVPPAVPSVFHNSSPRVESLAVKNSVSPTTIRFCGASGGVPAGTTRVVPVSVPSVRHSTLLVPSLAAKYRFP
jgi:hypothetical protein